MKTINYRICCTALAFLQIVLILTSCSVQNNSTGTTEDTGTSDENETTNEVYTGLPDQNLNAYDFRILARSGLESHCHHIEAFTVDEYVGERVNDAVYNRQLALQDRYNFNLKTVVVDESGSVWPEEFRHSVDANDNNFDIGVGATQHCQALAVSGYYLPWNELDYVDLTQPWWNQSAIDSLSVKNIVYYTMGDLTYETMDFTYCMYFNKQLCENWGISAESLYDTVEAGKWTLGELYTLTNSIYDDTNGNGERDVSDTYGVTFNTLSGQAIFQNATDTFTAIKDNDDIPHITFDIERLTGLVEKMYILMYENSGTFAVTRDYDTAGGFKPWWAMTSYKLSSSTSLFASGLFYEVFGEYSDIDFNIGFLPLPKYDVRQERYQTACDYHGPFTVVPKNADPEMVGFCAEAAAAYGRALITPAYYETALKHRYADTSRDSEMIDLIMRGLVYDMHSVYTTSSVLQTLIADKNINVSSYWKKNERALNRNFDKIVDTYLDYAD